MSLSTNGKWAYNYTIVKWLILFSDTQATKNGRVFKLCIGSKGDSMP